MKNPILGKRFTCKTDGIRPKSVDVKVLEVAKKACFKDETLDHKVWFVEYPKGLLNVMFMTLENGEVEADFTTDPDVGMDEVLMEYADVVATMKKVAKKHKIKVPDYYLN